MMLAEEDLTKYLDACKSGGLTVLRLWTTILSVNSLKMGTSQKKPIGFYPRLIELILPICIEFVGRKSNSIDCRLNTDSSSTNRIVIGRLGRESKARLRVRWPLLWY